MTESAEPITNTDIYVAILHVGLKRFCKNLAPVLMEAVGDECPANLLIDGAYEVILLEYLTLKNLFNQKHLLESNVNPAAIKICAQLYERMSTVITDFLKKLKDDAGSGRWKEDDVSNDDSTTFSDKYFEHIQAIFDCFALVKEKLGELEQMVPGLSALETNKQWRPKIIAPTIDEQWCL